MFGEKENQGKIGFSEELKRRSENAFDMDESRGKKRDGAATIFLFFLSFFP